MVKEKVDLTSLLPAEGKSEQVDLSSVIKSFLSDNDQTCLTGVRTKREEPDLRKPRYLLNPKDVAKGIIYNKSSDEPLKDTDISLSM